MSIIEGPLRIANILEMLRLALILRISAIILRNALARVAKEGAGGELAVILEYIPKISNIGIKPFGLAVSFTALIAIYKV